MQSRFVNCIKPSAPSWMTAHHPWFIKPQSQRLKVILSLLQPVSQTSAGHSVFCSMVHVTEDETETQRFWMSSPSSQVRTHLFQETKRKATSCLNPVIGVAQYLLSISENINVGSKCFVANWPHEPCCDKEYYNIQMSPQEPLHLGRCPKSSSLRYGHEVKSFQ